MVSPTRRILAAFALLAWALFAQAHEAGHGGGHGAAPKAKARPQLGASAAFDAEGRLWAVHAGENRVLLSVSHDQGRHWSEARPVNAVPEPVSADGDNRPKIAIGPRGERYVSWTRPLAKPYTGEIRLAVAPPPAEAGFAAPITVHHDRQQITHRFDALTVGAQGEVVVSWIDKRDLEIARGKKQGYRGAAIYFAVSRNGGASFEPEHKLADHSCECCRIGLVARRDGSLQALWRHVFEPSIRDHATQRFFADGRSEPMRRATLDDWALDACPHHGPSLVEDEQSGLHAVWFTGAPGREGAYYGRLAEDGMEGMLRIPDEAAEHADLAVSGEVVLIAWKSFDGQATRLRAMRSADRGQSWAPAVVLASTADASGQPQVLVRDGRFHVFWHTRETPLGVWALP